MATYINSDDIKVFPCSRRPGYLKDSRELTEENICNILKNSLKNFVCSTEEDLLAGNLNFYFNGYYFQLTNMTSYLESLSATKLYACIRLHSSNNYSDLGSVNTTKVSNPATNLDLLSDGKFYGFALSSRTSEITNGIVFKILERVSSSSTTWYIPEESKLSLDSDIIDGGIVQ